ITGQIRASYDYRDSKAYGKDKGALRSRIWIKGAVNEDWTYTAMLQNEEVFNKADGNKAEEGTSFQRAFVTGRVGGLAVKAGRDNQVLMDSEILNDRADMVQASYGKDIKVTAQYGKLNDKTVVGTSNGEKYWAVEAATKVAGVDLKALYVDVEDQIRFGVTDNEIWGIKAGYKLGDWGLKASYYKGDVEVQGEDDGYIFALNYKGAKASAPGSYGVYAQYRDMAASAWIANGDGSTICESFQNATDAGYEGYVVGANYALAKNIVAKVEYFDLEAKKGDNDAEVIWSEVVFTF
ncbi:MAG: porin, partial [Phascolarctobacterium sp.]|nr:porin [Phascolarctobacterium sp.]